jgi:cytochrome c
MYVKVAEAIRADMVNRGLSSLQQKGGEDLAKKKQMVTMAIANKYPQWAEDFTVTDRNSVPKRIQAFKEIVSDKRLLTDPNRTDMKYMAAYLQKREQFVKILQSRETAGGSATLSAKSNYDLSRSWDQFREAIAEKDTKFSATMERYLANDRLQTSIIKAE